MDRATIAKAGELLPRHKNLQKTITNVQSAQSSSKKTVLLLGSGRVAQPLVDYFAKKSNVRVVIGRFSCCSCNPSTDVLASNILEEAKAMSRGRENVVGKFLDVGNETNLSEVIKESDVVVR